VKIQRACNAAFTVFIALILINGLTACAIVDDVTLRAETMNATIGNYNNHAILLNIVRASKDEPLTFVAVTGGAPNTSLTGNAAVPAFTFAPWHLTQYAISGNTGTAAASNILAVAAVDDPGSWQALLTPVDVATIGFFIKQSYPRELLLRLFIDRIKVKNPSLAGGYAELVNDPLDPSFLYALKALANLVSSGLTVQINRGSSKVGDNPLSQLCYDKADAIMAQAMASKIPTASGRPFVPHPVSSDKCGQWFYGQATSTSTTSTSTTDTTKSSNADVKKTTGGTTSMGSASAPAGKVWYDLPAGRNEIQFTTRSAYAIFQYLGHIFQTGERSEFFTISDDHDLVTIVGSSATSCFSSVVFESGFFCVPDSAYNMKRTFSILHQVVGLNIVHSSSPAALAVRAVP
jgi:hypothetical protein